MLKRLGHPYVLLVLTALFWSGNWVVGRGLRTEVPPAALAFWRWTLAFGLTLPWAWPHRAEILPALRGHGWRLALLALLGVTGYNTLAYLGLQRTTATNGVLLNAFIPVAILVISCVFLGKRLALREGCGLLASLAGVAIIVAHGQFANLAAFAFNPGDLWILVSVVVWAVYTVLLQYRPRNLHPMALLAILIGIGVLGLMPIYAWELAQGRSIHPSALALAGIAYTGVFPGFVGYVFWNRAVAQVGAPVAGLFIHLMPVFTPILSAIFLGETPRGYHFAGMLLIVGGILFSTRRDVATRTA